MARTVQRPRVLLTGPLLQSGRRMLDERCEVVALDEHERRDVDAIRRRVVGCAGIVCQPGDRIDAGVLATPGLRVVSTVSRGVADIDLDAAARHGVVVTNTPLDPTESLADYAIGLMLAAARRIPEADRFMRTGRYRGWTLEAFLGRDLYRATLGLVAPPRLAAAIARRARGFDMRVVTLNGAGPLVRAEEVEIRTLLTASDVICVYREPGEDPGTRIGAPELALVKPTCVVVAMRTGVIVEAALIDALRERRIFAAAIDELEHEPDLPAGAAELPTLVLTPHIHSASESLREERAATAVRDLIAVLDGARPSFAVNGA